MILRSGRMLSFIMQHSQQRYSSIEQAVAWAISRVVRDSKWYRHLWYSSFGQLLLPQVLFLLNLGGDF